MAKLSNLFLIFGCIVLLSQSSCDKQGDDITLAPVVAIYHTEAYVNLPDSVRETFDGTKYPLHIHRILLPYNCPVSFIIVNEGPAGSVLKYSIDDIGALGGFLDYTNGVGTLNSGDYATITVTVDPEFTASGIGGVGWGSGSVLVLTINTPGASNSVKNTVSVHVMDYENEVQQLCGIWTGTWSGESQCAGPNNSVPVNGTWILNLQSVDLANQTATGTLTWNGSDVWWGYWYDEMNHAIPHYYNVDRTLIFSRFNTELRPGYYGAGNPCENISLYIYGGKSPYSSDGSPVFGGYGPDFFSNLSTDLKSINMGSRWSTNFYDPSYTNPLAFSQGILIGSKSQEQ